MIYIQSESMKHVGFYTIEMTATAYDKSDPPSFEIDPIQVILQLEIIDLSSVINPCSANAIQLSFELKNLEVTLNDPEIAVNLPEWQVSPSCPYGVQSSYGNLVNGLRIDSGILYIKITDEGLVGD